MTEPDSDVQPQMGLERHRTENLSEENRAEKKVKAF